MTGTNSRLPSFPRKLNTSEPPLPLGADGELLQDATPPSAVGGGHPSPGPSLTDDALEALMKDDLPPEGSGYRGEVVAVRDIVSKRGNLLAAVDIVTDGDVEVTDLLLVGAGKPSAMLFSGLQRARLYVDLSGKQVDRSDWAASKAAMMGTRIVFDVVHEIGRDNVVRAKVVNVRPAI